uniref:Minor capsid protein L2 n=1 Tax=Human papillomavirus TaxID=10566 RepID=A0A385PJI4_9PAPI|nr:MAG: L2 protein [Human papillomavirus]
MSRPRRIKRASDTDLYKSCALGGDCFPDVQNKVEGNTWADTLLKVFGSIIYLGNLGIGTGRGTGGQFGYRPFGGTRPSTSSTPIRPALPTDTVITGEVLPVTPIDSAIVPLTDGLPDTAVIDIPGAGPGISTDSVTVTTTIDPISEVTGVGEHPAVIYTTDNVAQLDVQLQPPPPKRILLDSTIQNTQTDLYTHASHVDSDYNVFVDAQFNGEHIGQPEEIELQEINLREEFEIDEGPLKSTPISSRVISKTRDLYHRFVEQVPTAKPYVQSRPSVTFEFENPAFESEIADVFNREVEQVREMATSEQLQDVIRLGDTRFSESPKGTIRVSRLGQRGGMITRSGLQIGKRVHFFYDVSPVPDYAIELRTFGEYSHEASIVDEMTNTSFINPFEQPIAGSLEFSEDVLLDNIEEDFGNSHVVLATTDTEGDTLDIPTFPPEFSVKVFVNDYGKSLNVHYPVNANTSIIYPDNAFEPLQPATGVHIYSGDFDLHPSLLKRKRKHWSSV